MATVLAALGCEATVLAALGCVATVLAALGCMATVLAAPRVRGRVLGGVGGCRYPPPSPVCRPTSSPDQAALQFTSQWIIIEYGSKRHSHNDISIFKNDLKQ